MKLLLMLAMVVLASLAQSPDVRFREAKQKETVEGDLRGAIQLYQEVADAKDSSRDLAAQALLRLGRCYEKLGSTESKKAYERLVRQYEDQPQAVNEARRRLAALTPTPAAKGELTAKLLTRFDERARADFDLAGMYENVATDGRFLFRISLVSPWILPFESTLEVIDLASGSAKEILRGKFESCGLLLSPDGQQLAFSTREVNLGQVRESIYVVRTDGAQQKRVFTNVSERMQSPFLGSWSPDGREIAFTERAAGKPSELKLLSVKEGSVRTWTQLSATRNGVFPGKLSFSPDGQFLAYDVSGVENGGAYSIRILRRGSQEPFVLALGNSSNKVLGWFPDGRELLFASDRRGTVDAYRIQIADGKVVGEATLVRTNIGSGRSLGFRPNGSFYLIDDGSTRSVNVAGFDLKSGMVKGPRQVVTQSFVDAVFAPSWSPDGSKLVYETVPTPLRLASPTMTARSLTTNEDWSIPLAHGLFGASPVYEWSRDSEHLNVERYGTDAELATFEVDVHSGETKRVAPAWCQHAPREDSFLCSAHANDGPTFGQLDKYDPKTGQMTKFKDPQNGLMPFCPMPDGKHILYAGYKSVALLPTGEGEGRVILKAEKNEILATFGLIGSQKLTYLRLREGKPSAWIHDIESGEDVEIKGIDLSRISVEGIDPLMSFHPNGDQVVWVSNEGKSELWALENFRLPAEHLAGRK